MTEGVTVSEEVRVCEGVGEEEGKVCGELKVTAVLIVNEGRLCEVVNTGEEKIFVEEGEVVSVMLEIEISDSVIEGTPDSVSEVVITEDVIDGSVELSPLPRLGIKLSVEGVASVAILVFLLEGVILTKVVARILAVIVALLLALTVAGLRHSAIVHRRTLYCTLAML